MIFFKLNNLVAAVTLIFACNLAFAVEQIMVNGLFKDKAIVTIDGKRSVLRKGERAANGILLIKANSKEAIIEFNGEQKTYSLATPLGSNHTQKAKNSSNQKVVVITDAGGLYQVSGSINGFSVRFIVDTGASVVSMNSNVAKRLGIDYKLTGTESASYTASGIDKIYVVNLKRVRVGGIELRNVSGAVHEGAFPAVTLLGMSFLGKLNMKREGRVLELQQKY